jgi:hypothetical protein
MQHLEIIAVIALVPLGAWIAMGEGMVLEWWAKLWTATTTTREFYTNAEGIDVVVKEETKNDYPLWLHKPLATCPRCMVSAWGIPAALLTFPDMNLWLLPVYLLAACGLQEAIHR